ncbi:MAG: ABC transporter ATP-binding protein [Actinomycetes bacterium]
MTAPAVSVEGVSKQFRLYHERNQSLKAAVMRGGRARFEDFRALDDVSFDVQEGVTFGLIGENGSGKSTLLKCIARILRPDIGRISSHGTVSALLELGAGFHPELSGRENVYLNGSILGMSKKQVDACFDSIVDFSGIEPFIDTPVKNYSSGMYVRLGFAVAISIDPEILLVDEVLAVGDAEFQQKCTDKILEFKADGRTVVVVSHSMPAVRNLCDEVALLEHGKLIDVGSAASVIDEYMVEVFADRQFDVEDGARWGSGEIRLERFRLLGDDGVAVDHCRTGDPVTLSFEYAANEEIRHPLFGASIYTADGVYVAGPNTRDAGLLLDAVQGSGRVELRIDHLPLVPGAYDVSAAIHDDTGTHPYDFREKMLRFNVELGNPRESWGIVSLGGQWSASPGGR